MTMTITVLLMIIMTPISKAKILIQQAMRSIYPVQDLMDHFTKPKSTISWTNYWKPLSPNPSMMSIPWISPPSALTPLFHRPLPNTSSIHLMITFLQLLKDISNTTNNWLSLCFVLLHLLSPTPLWNRSDPSFYHYTWHTHNPFDPLEIITHPLLL